MNKKIFGASFLILCLIFLIMFATNKNIAVASSDQSQQKTEINVRGSASLYVEPDIAKISLGVISEDISADVAYSKTSSKINKIISALKNAGVSQKDIQTLQINVYAKYSYNKDDNTSKIVGFYAQTNLGVIVRNLSMLGKIIDLAFKNGANNFNDLRFDISDSNKYYNQALSKALENAKSKAKVLADGFGITLGKPKSISENTFINNPPIVYNEMKSEAAAGTSQIATGTIEIRAEVNLLY